MKKIIALSLLVILILSGCTAKNSNNQNNNDPSITGEYKGQLKNDEHIRAIVNALDENFPVNAPDLIDESSLNSILYLNSEKVEEYAGRYNLMNETSDNIIAVRAKKDKIADVIESLEKRKTDVMNHFKDKNQDEYNKAKAGKVVDVGDYVFLVILGDAKGEFKPDIARAIEKIHENFI